MKKSSTPHTSSSSLGTEEEDLPEQLKMTSSPQIPVLKLELSEREASDLEWLQQCGWAWYDIQQADIVAYIRKLRDEHLISIYKLRTEIRDSKLKCQVLKQYLDDQDLRFQLPTSVATSYMAKALEASFDRWYLARSHCTLNFQIHRNLVISYGGEEYAPSLAIYPMLPKTGVLLDGILSQQEQNEVQTLEIDENFDNPALGAMRHPVDIAYYTQYRHGTMPSIVLLVQEIRNLNAVKQCIETLASIWFELPHLKLLLVCFIITSPSKPSPLEKILIVGVHAVDQSHVERFCQYPESDQISAASCINVEGITYSDLPFQSSQEWNLDTSFLNQYVVSSMLGLC